MDVIASATLPEHRTGCGIHADINEIDKSAVVHPRKTPAFANSHLFLPVSNTCSKLLANLISYGLSPLYQSELAYKSILKSKANIFQTFSSFYTTYSMS